MNWSRDLRYAWRTPRRAPGFASAAVLTIGLGVGVTTAVLTVADTVLRRPLPYPPADRLVRFVDEPSANGPAERTPTTVEPEELAELERRLTLVTDLGVYVGATATITSGGEAIPLTITRMSASFFPMLGVSPVLGRPFTRAEERGASALPLVLSDAAWRRIFGGAASVIGRPIMVDGAPAEVVGVMPASFAFPDRLTDAWVPFQPVAVRGRAQRYLVYGALREGAPLPAAAAEVTTVLQGMRGFPTPDEYRAAGEPAPFGLVSWKEDVVGPVRPVLGLLAAAASLVLLLACVNIATLLVARGTARTREVATRIAIGASRGQVVGALLAESVVLATLGGAVGLALATVGLRWLTRWGTALPRRDLGAGVSIPRLDEIAVNPATFVMVVGLVVVSTAIAGLWPALRLTAQGARMASTWSDLTQGGATRRLGHAGLLTAQVALAVTLLIGGVLTMRSLTALLGTELGFEPNRVLTLRLAFPAGRYSRESLEAFSHRVVDQLRQVPGVRSAAYGRLPLAQSRAGSTAATVPPRPNGPGTSSEQRTLAHVSTWVHHAYFETLHLQISQGRGLRLDDDLAHPRVVVVNEAFVRAGLLGERPIGRLLYFGTSPEPWEVVGVVRNATQFVLGGQAEPEVFFDARQRPALPIAPGRGPVVLVRAEDHPDELIPRLRDALRAVDQDATFIDVATMDAIVDQALARPRLYAGVMNLFALAALTIATWGVAGVVAYTVSQRRREIGIRLTLGATPGRILRAAVAPVMLQSGLGVVAGLALAIRLADYLDALLVGVSALEPDAFALAAGVMVTATTVAAVLAARSAAVVDPAANLRAE